MIYPTLPEAAPLTQGEIIDRCPLLTWTSGNEEQWEPAQLSERVLILTQACDLANPSKQRVTAAVVKAANALVEQQILNAGTIRDNIRRHGTFGWYFLPAGDQLPESVVDLHGVFTVPRSLLEQLVREGHRICRLVTPYREHLAQHFAVTYSRIGLPEPYETE